MNKKMMRLLPAVLLAAFSSQASAAAFQLLEQNASGLGVSYAGSAAVADNASTIFYNPAGMTMLPGRQISLGVNAIGPSYKFTNIGTNSTFGLTGSNGGDAGGWAAVPNAYVSWQLAPQWFVGLGISAPFGLATEYEDPNWIGRYHALKSEIKTVNLNPSLAYRVNDKVALGFGLNYQRIEAEMGNMAAPGTIAVLKGKDSAWGWNAGALFNLSPAMRVGVSYRSAMKYDLEGDQFIGAAITPVRAKLKLPDTFILSVWQQVSDRWEAMGDFSYTRWDSLNRLDIYHRATGASRGSEPFGYENSWRIAWGAAYKYNDAWKLKFGIAYDRTPVSDLVRSARVPDNNRIWLSLGAQWKPARDSMIDVGYAYLYVKDTYINQAKTFTWGGGNAATLNGRYDTSAHILGVQFTQGF
ncbi:MAG: Membrane protein involved in aromatic hydrocarbon degradation [Proteobacteria bacterium]|nr:Membrane protein involved in aromatic hydrocarbon degradation [Pseudomonadota bacterium]